MKTEALCPPSPPAYIYTTPYSPPQGGPLALTLSPSGVSLQKTCVLAVLGGGGLCLRRTEVLRDIF
jgi:hypothetical protein